ncbi:MAG: aconitase X swivel domain-containing protein [Nitrosopumilaceae archaeon]
MTLKVIVKGKVVGKILKSKNPINFLGAVDKKTGIIRDQKHDLFEKSLKNSILVFPHGIGSSVGAYTIYSLKSNNSAPIAMICKKADLSVVSGCALANIPMVIANQEQYDSLVDGQEITLDAESGNFTVN